MCLFCVYMFRTHSEGQIKQCVGNLTLRLSAGKLSKSFSADSKCDQQNDTLHREKYKLFL